MCNFSINMLVLKAYKALKISIKHLNIYKALSRFEFRTFIGIICHGHMGNLNESK